MTRVGSPGVAADVHLHAGAVLQRHHAPQLQGNGDPLVLADAAVVVSLEEGQLAVLIQGIGLQVQPGRVDVGGGDLGAIGQGLVPDVGQQDGLAPVAEVQLVAALYLHAPNIGLVPLLLRQTDGLGGAEALRLSGIQKSHVALAIVLHGLQIPVLHQIIAVLLGGQQLFLQFLICVLIHGIFPP